MKYFTMKWWSGESSNPDGPGKLYQAYLTEVQDRLPAGIVKFIRDSSLHDGQLRVWKLLPAEAKLELQIDGFNNYAGDEPRHYRIEYGGVMSVESTGDPNVGLAGPHGYGDLGYDEFEVLADDLFEHRMLFSTGIELTVRFKSFSCKHYDLG
jgi:hypothetical protein